MTVDYVTAVGGGGGSIVRGIFCGPYKKDYRIWVYIGVALSSEITISTSLY